MMSSGRRPGPCRSARGTARSARGRVFVPFDGCCDALSGAWPARRRVGGDAIDRGPGCRAYGDAVVVCGSAAKPRRKPYRRCDDAAGSCTPVGEEAQAGGLPRSMVLGVEVREGYRISDRHARLTPRRRSASPGLIRCSSNVSKTALAAGRCSPGSCRTDHPGCRRLLAEHEHRPWRRADAERPVVSIRSVSGPSSSGSVVKNAARSAGAALTTARSATATVGAGPTARRRVDVAEPWSRRSRSCSSADVGVAIEVPVWYGARRASRAASTSTRAGRAGIVGVLGGAGTGRSRLDVGAGVPAVADGAQAQVRAAASSNARRRRAPRRRRTRRPDRSSRPRGRSVAERRLDRTGGSDATAEPFPCSSTSTWHRHAGARCSPRCSAAPCAVEVGRATHHRAGHRDGVHRLSGWQAERRARRSRTIRPRACRWTVTRSRLRDHRKAGVAEPHLAAAAEIGSSDDASRPAARHRRRRGR